MITTVEFWAGYLAAGFTKNSAKAKLAQNRDSFVWKVLPHPESMLYIAYKLHF